MFLKRSNRISSVLKFLAWTSEWYCTMMKWESGFKDMSIERLNAMRSFRPDLVIEDADGHPIAVVEVKSRTNLSSDVAAEMRRNIMERGLPAHIPYFLLLSQDVGYMWKETKQNNGANDVPTYMFPMDKVIARYSKRVLDRRLYETELSLLVLQWLTHLSTGVPETSEEPERTLALSGFSDSIKDAMVLIEEEL
jgi:hypothetical protein